MRTSITGLTGLLAFVATAPAAAQDTAPPPPITVSGGATIVSDYRFRGVSLSDEDFALQGTLNVNHESGFYAGTWASTLDDADGASAFGGVEVDLYAGWTGEVSPGTSVDGGLLYYLYPDSLSGTNTDFFEPYAAVSHIIGPVTGKLGAAYAPEQGSATGGNDWLYVYGQVSGSVPRSPVTLTARLGNQDFGGGASYTEWAVGAAATFGSVIAGVQYVDTDLGDLPNVDAGLVFSVGFAF